MIALFAAGFLTTPERSPAETNKEQDQSLDHLVRSFFLEDHPGRRRTLRTLIEEASNRSFDSVAQAVRNVHIWPELTRNTGKFSFELPSRQVVQVNYSLPLAYDPSQAYPMVLCFRRYDMGPFAEFPYDSLDSFLGPHSADFVTVFVSEAIGERFYQTVDTSYDLPSFLVELRRMFHLDANRTYLLFESRSDFATPWLTAAKHPDEFAGIICHPLSLVEMFYSLDSFLLLRNLRSTQWIWSSQWNGATPNEFTFGEVRSFLREQFGTSFEDSLGTISDKTTAPDVFLDRHRQTPRRSISFWFRYPGQGEIAWLKQTRFAGPVWEEEQLSVRPAPGVDYRDFLEKTLEDLLAYLGAQVQGQTINIQTRKCARIEVTLPIDLVDLSQPVTIRINGKRRHHKKINPSIRVLLDTAYKRWDFQNLAAARLSFSVRSDSPKP